MARPTIVPINSGNQGWDDRIDDDLDVITAAPIPIFESAAITSLAGLETVYPAAAHDRCLIWINLTTYGYTLCWSNGAAWIPFGDERRPKTQLSATTTQVVSDKFVRFTGAGSVDYDFLASAAWAGQTVEVRNDSAATINLDPNGSETINGGGAGSPLVLAVGSTARVYSDGAALFASVAL